MMNDGEMEGWKQMDIETMVGDIIEMERGVDRENER